MKRTSLSITRALALALLLLALVILGGCDSGAPSDDPEDMSSFTENTLILEVDEYPVYWPEFKYWLKVIADYYKEASSLESITDWTVEENGVTLEEFFLSTAVDYAGRHRALEKHAEEMGIEVPQAALDDIAATRAENIEIYGSEVEYRRIVNQMYVSDKVYTYLVEMGYLSSEVFSELYGDGGEKCSDEDVAAYAAEKGLMCARYVFLSNTGTGTAELTEAEKAANRELLEDLARQLEASDDPEALFASFVQEHNTDGQALTYPDGVLFVAGDMGQEFETAYAALAENQYSGIVETAEGLYLIMRLPVRPDMAADASGSTLRYRAAYEHLYQAQVNAWYADMDVDYARAYDLIDVKTLFD